MKKGMKAMAKKKSMAMKRRAMKKSIIAKGKMGKSSVFRGTKVKTSGGLKKTDLMRNKNGKVVSKKSSAAGKRAYAKIREWTDAVSKARKALSLRGFVAVNGKTAQGRALYAKAKSFYSK